MKHPAPHFAMAFACEGKERYATQARAMAVVRRRVRRAKRRHHKSSGEDRRELARLGAYHCNFCHHWHVGSDHDPRGR